MNIKNAHTAPYIQQNRKPLHLTLTPEAAKPCFEDLQYPAFGNDDWIARSFTERDACYGAS